MKKNRKQRLLVASQMGVEVKLCCCMGIFFPPSNMLSYYYKTKTEINKSFNCVIYKVIGSVH